MRLLDLFCGRFGWSRAFAERGWECVGVDLVAPPEIPEGCEFFHADILNLNAGDVLCLSPDFICASSPCEQFSVHGMKHFHPDPPHPELGIKLFNHTRLLCEAAGLPYVMENVRAAQQFVGDAVNHCGPFYLWGNAVPTLLPQGISKAKWTMQANRPGNAAPECWLPRKRRAAKLATIPAELAACVADYAMRTLEVTA